MTFGDCRFSAASVRVGNELNATVVTTSPVKATKLVFHLRRNKPCLRDIEAFPKERFSE